MALPFDVAFDDLFGHANGADEITDRPNASGSPVDFVEKWKLFTHVPGGIGLDQAHCLRDCQLWCNTHEDVRVILIGVDLMDDDLRAVARYFSYFQLEIVSHAALENTTTVFGRDHQMIPNVEYGVTCPIVLHESSVLPTKTADSIHLRPDGRRIVSY